MTFLFAQACITLAQEQNIQVDRAYRLANSRSTEPALICSQISSLWRATRPGSPIVSATVAPLARAALMAWPTALLAPCTQEEEASESLVCICYARPIPMPGCSLAPQMRSANAGVIEMLTQGRPTAEQEDTSRCLSSDGCCR